MEEWLHHFIQGLPLYAIFIIIIVALGGVGKFADILVDEAVLLSRIWKIPTAIVGATIVSLGTTTPEVAISVLAAIKGSPDLALGNAVGSIICDTGLILGIATLIKPLPIDRKIVAKQGWLQLAAGFLLVGACIPWSNPANAFQTGGVFTQVTGFAFLALLLGYILLSIKWAKKDNVIELNKDESKNEPHSEISIFIKLVLSIVAVVFFSWILIPSVQEAAIRMHIPQSIIAATMVAFGTSLPELVTAVTASLKGHGELALGNVIGADILNVLFVAGASAAVTKQGLTAPSQFFTIFFPAMLFVLIILRIGLHFSKNEMKRPFGVILLLTYVLVTFISYIYRG